MTLKNEVINGIKTERLKHGKSKQDKEEKKKMKKLKSWLKSLDLWINVGYLKINLRVEFINKYERNMRVRLNYFEVLSCCYYNEID